MDSRTNGEKLKMYFTTDPNCNVFAYAPGEFPYEFAPDIDYDTQFSKAFLEPIKVILDCMGWKTEKVSSLEDFFA